MHVEIKAAMLNFVAYDKSRKQPNIYFRTHFFRTKFSHQLFFTQMEKKIRVGTKNKGRVGSPEPDSFFYFALQQKVLMPLKNAQA